MFRASCWTSIDFYSFLWMFLGWWIGFHDSPLPSCDQTLDPKAGCLDDIQEWGIVAEKADDSPVQNHVSSNPVLAMKSKSKQTGFIGSVQTCQKAKHSSLAADATTSSPCTSRIACAHPMTQGWPTFWGPWQVSLISRFAEEVIGLTF